MAKNKALKKGAGLWKEFKEFINRGNAFMLAVGVVIGGAFSAIVNAFVSMLTSLATWPVPGGLKGLVTVLPAVTDAQKGAAFLHGGEVINRQFFTTAEANDMVIEFAAAQGKTITVESTDFIQWKNSLLSLYDLHGTTFTSKMSAIVDWGTLINAIISFLIIALVLFIIVKVMNTAARKREELEAKRLELYYEKHPEERPVPPEPGKPAPTQEELLTGILEELKKANGEKAAKE
ncbi:MAG: MscL family protein [Bacilli bacterium]|nr:MscL family protein [Bacilli bacterium]